MDPVTEKVFAAIALVKHIPAEQITLNSSLDELQFDSLDRVTFLFELEKQFDLAIPDEQAQTIRTVRDVVDGMGKLAGQASTVTSPGSL